ncbi:hypothetical protein MKW94_012758 [Papaver nudicaule]|uniref:Pectinesterase inhibitor domain-containing protein n=1 Tax=Papaver nudicaule TaxID=74823 RepID=A0AA41RPA7_PAPNU|nr:hypothetical protein [Papaver nudicaule]
MASSSRLLLVLTFMFIAFSVSQSDESSEEGDEYVRSACSVTRYQDICIRSLEAYSNSAKHDSRKWAQAAVTVTLAEAKNMTHYLNKLKHKKSIRKKGRRQRIDLSECIDCFEETVENVKNSLHELRKLNGKTFDVQMGNVETWMSSALTYEDTCIDGFENRKGKQVKLLRSRIMKLSYITSNALALVSKLASAGDEINA